MSHGIKNKAPYFKTPTGQHRKKSPKMMLFLRYYNDPKSETFNNARQSALKAGYSENYANNITAQSPSWITADIKREQMLKKAEENLEALLSMNEDELKKNPQLLKIWQDTAKFVSERLGKEFYSTRQEHTGKDGKQLFTHDHATLAEQALDQLLQS